ncbi:acetyl-CoA carboxylase biotin carboxylase subunit [Salinicoccus halitifaciens]|uniref:acetyl-CoA carboxylase biotin carboxylase subunit n=1 Tax=Salinicoccus halitifaciens TaxID=1073415 RepID=UPI001E5AFDE3|nr:acetyl-CoA carboxylase biotin carboxylase subunit [Salinicoccus halitifaciens]MCD2136910.1 acetyl-CoA carboxylase biotin carboxylase subunit [Salinicoccus halitifaciens]
MKKVLVANRGEIAVRIIRACSELGIESVSIYSEADKDSLHRKIATESYCIGPKLSKDSYLDMISIITIAKKTGCDAVHPGYGFLAENSDFAEMCESSNLIFIGPMYETISLMGVKDVAKNTMEKAGVPTVPGSDGVVQSIEHAMEVAGGVGYPVIIKASYGGGGKGIRVARNEEELIQNYKMTEQEAESAFGNKSLYIEKYIENFRHIEIQVLGDYHGNVVHLGERDCTVQRRMQKLVEEAPSPVLTEEKRREMGETAVRAAKSIDYIGAGTIEFIYDLNDDNFYFMEMNTRIQVEHPVTEMITGIDLVKMQLKIAMREEIPFKQEDIKFNGHAIEYRINAENPSKNFMPSAGKITNYITPGGFGVRMDTAAYSGYTIPPYYDSMIAKLIVHSDSREEAINISKRALGEFIIDGIDTTIPFHMNLLKNDDFITNNYNTNFLAENDIMV